MVSSRIKNPQAFWGTPKEIFHFMLIVLRQYPNNRIVSIRGMDGLYTI